MPWLYSLLVWGDLDIFCAVEGLPMVSYPHIQVPVQHLGNNCSFVIFYLILYVPSWWSPNLVFLPQFSGLVSGNLWRNLSSWMPQREVAADQVLCYLYKLSLEMNPLHIVPTCLYLNVAAYACLLSFSCIFPFFPSFLFCAVFVFK